MATLLFTENEFKQALLNNANLYINDAIEKTYTYYNDTTNIRTSTSTLCLANELLLKAFYIYSYANEISHTIFANCKTAGGKSRQLSPKLLNPENDPSIDVNKITKIEQIELLKTKVLYDLVKGDSSRPDNHQTKGINNIFEGFPVVFNFPQEQIPNPPKNYPGGSHDLGYIFDRLPEKIKNLILYRCYQSRSYDTSVSLDELKENILKDNKNGMDLLNILFDNQLEYYDPFNERMVQMFINYRYPGNGVVSETDLVNQKALVPSLLEISKLFVNNINSVSISEELSELLDANELNILNSLNEISKNILVKKNSTLVKKIIDTYCINNNYDSVISFNDFVFISQSFDLWDIYNSVEDLNVFIRDNIIPFINNMNKTTNNVEQIDKLERWTTIQKEKCSGDVISIINKYDSNFFNLVYQQEELMKLCKDNDVIYLQSYDNYYNEIKYLIRNKLYISGESIPKELYSTARKNRLNDEIERISELAVIFLHECKNIVVDVDALKYLLSKYKNIEHSSIISQIDKNNCKYLDYENELTDVLYINEEGKLLIKKNKNNEVNDDEVFDNDDKFVSFISLDEPYLDSEFTVSDLKNEIFNYLNNKFGYIDEYTFEKTFSKIKNTMGSNGLKYILYIGYVVSKLDSKYSMLDITTVNDFYDLLFDINNPEDFYYFITSEYNIELDGIDFAEISVEDLSKFNYTLKCGRFNDPYIAYNTIENLDVKDPLVMEFFDKVVLPICSSCSYWTIEYSNNQDYKSYKELLKMLANSSDLVKLYNYYCKSDVFKEILTMDFSSHIITHDSINALIALFNSSYSDEEYLKYSKYIIDSKDPKSVFEFLSYVKGKINPNEIFTKCSNASIFGLHYIYKTLCSDSINISTKTRLDIHKYICDYNVEDEELIDLNYCLLKLTEKESIIGESLDEFVKELLKHTNRAFLLRKLDSFKDIKDVKSFFEYTKFCNLLGDISYNNFRFINQLAKKYQSNDYVDLIVKLEFLESIGKPPYTVNGTDFKVHDNSSAVFFSSFEQLSNLVNEIGVDRFELDYLYFDLNNFDYYRDSKLLFLIYACIGRYKGNTDFPALKRELIFKNMINFVNRYPEGIDNIFSYGEILIVLDPAKLNKIFDVCPSLKDFNNFFEEYDIISFNNFKVIDIDNDAGKPRRHR